MVYMIIVRVSSCLNKELAWATDKWLQVISNTMLHSNSYITKELKNKTILQCCMHCYVVLSNVF